MLAHIMVAALAKRPSILNQQIPPHDSYLTVWVKCITEKKENLAELTVVSFKMLSYFVSSVHGWTEYKCIHKLLTAKESREIEISLLWKVCSSGQ